MTDQLEWGSSTPKQTVVTISEWPYADIAYTTVLLRLPGDYEVRLSGPDAQRLGQAITRAGGGE